MNLKSLLAAPLLLALGVAPALSGPDFTGPADRPTKYAASWSTRPIQPSDDIVFMHDSAGLLDSGIKQVDRIAAYLKEHPKQKVIVAGHANSLGSARHNEELATRRAEIVREHLIGHGISSDRIVVLVYGKNEAVKRPSPTDRRVVVFATTEAPATVARRELRNRKVISATYTRGDVLITETAKTGHTGATITEQVAGR